MSELETYKNKFRRLVELRERADETEQEAKRAKQAYRNYEAELYSELEEAGIRGRHEFDFGPPIGVVKFQRATTMYGRVVDKQAAIAALHAEGLDHLISQTKFEEARLNELVRDRLESKADLPEGIDFYHRKRIAISRK